jgi:protein involved in polysaccharide export with SLBB domain
VGQLSQRDLVSAPRVLGDTDLSPDGNIAVDLAGALKRPGGEDDLLLVDGDTITIPERPSTVQVVGAVFNARGVLFKPGAKLDHYVAQCGGFTPDAASDRIVVIHAGGGLVPASKAGALRPGDVVVVPTRVLAEKLSRRGGGLDGLFRGITNSAITLRLATSLFGL